MAENKKVIIDPTKTGPLSYRDLQAQNANGFDTATQESEYTPEFQTYLNEMNSKYQPLSQTDADLNREQEVKSPLYDTDTPWGESMWDDDVANEEQFQHLGDVRANNQPWYAKIAAGVAKGALTAGTTIINSWVGLPVGIIESFKDGDVSRIWDNNLTRATQSLMDWGEKTFKNYRTEAEENDPWYKHILSANFLATGLIQNTGFMIGAAYSGGPIYKGLSKAGNAFVKGRQIAAVGKALGVTGKKAAKEALETAIKTGNGLNRVKNAINAVNKTGVPLSKGIAGIVASTIAGVGEGAIEAQNNSRDWYKSKKMKYDDEFNRQAEEIEKLYGPENSPEKQAAQDKLYKEYDSLMSNAAQEAARMGNWDLALNIPLLAFGDYKQFIRNWSGGWKTAKRLSKVKGGVEVKKGANGAIESIKGNFKKSSGKAGLVKAATKRAVLEGSEEMNQAAINKFAGYYTDDVYVTPFYNATKNPEAIQETLGYWNKFAKGIMSLCGGLKDTWGDFNNYEEFFIGALSGGFGLPTFRRMKNKDGSWQSPIAFKDSAYQDVQEYRNWMKKEEELVQRMNDRVQSPEFLNAYKNLVRNNKYQKDMDAAVEANSEVDFKDAQFNQLVSDIVMFDTAGRLDDLKELVKAATDSKNFSDEDLDQIVATTTDLSEEGKVISPFVDENGNVMSKEKIREQLEKNGKKVLEAIDSYQATKELLQNQINEEIPREGFEELVWMQVQLDGWRSRMSSMSKDIKTALKPVKERLKSAIAKNDEILKKNKKEDSTDKPKTKEQEEVEKLNKVYNSILNTIDNIDNMEDAADVVAALEVHPELGSLIHNEGGLKFLEQVIDAAEAIRIVDLAKDIKTLNERSELFQKKLKEYTEAPQKVAEDQKKSDEKREKEAKDKKNKPARERLLNTKSPKEFRDVLNSLNDADREAILKEFDTDQGQPFQPYVDYKRTESYKKAVEKLIYNSGLGEQLQKDVLSLFNAHYNNSNSLEELGNRKSAIIQDSDFFTEDSESIEEAEERYNNALVALDSIMYKVNNNKVFSDSFTKEFKKAPEKITKKETGGGPIRSTDKDTTGSSGTSTVPPVVGRGEKETPSTVPPGSQSLEEMLEENKEQKDSSEEEQERVYKANREGNTLTFIIPAVPEMHVNAGGKITIKDKDTGEEKEVDVPYEDFYKVAAELEGKNFQKIWEYLRDAGAFEYVNSGKLEPGAEIGFMIDPNWEKQLEGVSWHKQPTIFLIDKKNGQIVGSLFESMYKQKEYAGLENLVKNIIEEYNANKNKGNNNQITGKEVDDLILDILESIRHDITESKYDDLKDRFAIPSITFHIKKLLEKYKDNIVGEAVDLYKVAEKIKQLFYEGTVRRSKEDLEGESAKMDEIYDYIDSLFGTLDPSSDTSNRFVYSKTTNVSAVINGKIPIGNTEQSIQNVNGVLTRVNSKGETETVKPLFAIVKNGTLVTGGKVPASKVVMPKNLSDKEGNLYLLVPNAKGQYTPMSLRVKHFNTEEFSLDDTTNANSVKGIELVKAITALSKISSTEDLHKAVASLKSVLFIPDNYHFDYYNNDKGSGIIIKIAEVDPLTKEEVYEKNDDGSFVLTESGKKKRKEETIFINFSSKKSAEDTLDEELSKAGSDEEYEAILASSGNLEGTEEVKDPATIQKEITDALLGFNLSFQVSIDGINTEGYNESLIVSDIITSNITDATCRSSWFTCDYFNDKGEKQGGKLPEVKHEETPSGDGSLIKSTEVPVDYVINGSTFKYKVNLDTGEIYQDSVPISHTFDEEKRALIYGMASYKYKYPNGSSADLDVIQHVYDVQNGVPQKTITAFVFNSKEGKTYVYDTANKKLVTDTELADAIISRLNKMNAPLGDCVPKFKTSKDTTTDTKEEPKKDEPKEEPKKEPLVVTSENDYGNNEHAIREGSVIQTFSIIDIKNPENPPIPTKAPVTELTTINGHKIFLFSKPYNERVEEGDGEDDSFNCWDYEFYAVSDNGKAVVLAQKKEVIMAAVEPKLQSRLVDVLNQKQDAIKVLTEDDGTNPPDNPEQPKKYSHGTPFGESDIPFNPPSAEPTEDKKDSTGAPSVELNADELGDVFDDNTPNDDEYDYDDIDKYKKTNEEEVEVWNKEKELKWLDRVLPQLSREDRVRIVSGLINTAEAGEKAWGMVSKGIITLSDIAVKGTMYHEAFHIVFNYLLDENQKQKILEEARQRWGNLKRLDLEEELAEAFKEYTLTEDSRGLGRRILDFFKNLLTKITHWHRVQPHTYSLFRQINQGKFANMKLNVDTSNNTMYSEEKYTSEMQDIKDQAIKDGTFMKAPNGEDTHLTERQWLQVRTKAFKEWFGDWENDPENASKVVDPETGEPMVVYHATDADFTTFSYDNFGKTDSGTVGKGFYFSANKDYIKHYGNKVIAVFLNIKEPVDLRGKGYSHTDIQAYISINDKIFWAQTNIGQKRPSDGVIVDQLESIGLNNKTYDSVEYVSFDPNQIKSATDNVGTFSTENDDIRYSLVGKKGLQRSTTDTTKNNNTIERTKAILKSLEDAKSMDSRKYTPLQIKRLTGWEKDYNGKWKYETVKDISISQEKVDSIKKEIENIDTMYDVPEVKYLFTELFKGSVADFLVSAYPELKDFTFVFFNNPSATYNGVTSDNEIAITHLDRNINDINDTILHEVQHFIQRMEGDKITDTSKGVDSDAVLNNPDFIKESSVPGLSEEQITQLKHKYYQKIGNESEAYAVQGRLAGKEYRHESIANKHIYDWEVLSEENRKGLERKGYTKEKWEQIDDFIFKDNALRCIAF